MVPYVVAGLLVAAVGFWGLKSGVAGGPEPAATLLTLRGETGASQAGAAFAGEGRGETGALGPAATTTTIRLFVQVAGAVVRPGVYEVEPGARVFQVLLLAGGMEEDADEEAVPLAAVVVDGGRIWVPRVGDPPGSAGAILSSGTSAAGTPGTGDGGGGGSVAKVVLSSAGEAELDTLPGVGPKTAQQIIAYREAHGPFRSVEELAEVPGIGPATVERLRELVVP